MPEAPTISHRQLKLFHIENPLSVRLGNEFFLTLPAVPGVYFFYGNEGTLLYIGQSADLRARIGSYRHVTPEKHPKRTLRLVSRIVRIEWQECTTAEEAIERERVLLLEHRPPFNRAGVWQGEPWWLSAEARDGCLQLELSREQNERHLGPLPSSFRYVFGSLVRCLYRLALPDRSLAAYPHGITSLAVPLSLRLSLPNADTSLQQLSTCISGQIEELLAKIAALPPPSPESEQDYWQDDVERLTRWATGRRTD